MEYLFEIIKVLLPSLIVFLTAYLILSSFLKNEKNKKIIEVKKNIQKETLLLRLQAYERLLLLLERIKPQSVIMRINTNNETALSYHVQLLATIRSEFEHNIAQQLYVSNEAWEIIVSAKEETLKNLNITKEKINDEDSALFLVRQIINECDKKPTLIQTAIDFLKNEVRFLF